MHQVKYGIKISSFNRGPIFFFHSILQASFRSMEIEEMYLKYCMQMKRPLIIILLVIILIVSLSIMILHIAEDKVIISTIIGPIKHKKFAKNCNCFLIHQFKHVFWVLKRTVLSRWFF